MNMLKRNQPRTIKTYEVNKIHKPREKLVYVPVLQDYGRLVKKTYKASAKLPIYSVLYQLLLRASC